MQVLFTARGANEVVNIPDEDLGRAPLHIAVRGHEPAVVRLLQEHGASVEQKDIFGKTPADYCKQRTTEACQALR